MISHIHKFTTGQIEYTMAVIGCDEDWEEYMVCVIIDQFDNFFDG